MLPLTPSGRYGCWTVLLPLTPSGRYRCWTVLQIRALRMRSGSAQRLRWRLYESRRQPFTFCNFQSSLIIHEGHASCAVGTKLNDVFRGCTRGQRAVYMHIKEYICITVLGDIDEVEKRFQPSFKNLLEVAMTFGRALVMLLGGACG